MNIIGLRSETHAIKLLTADHREVDGLFEEFESTDNALAKVSIVNRICEALIVHAEVEERLFYPESRRVLGKDSQDMVDEAFVEHATLKGLIIRLDGMHANEPLFKAYVTVLKEYVQHHVKEEESEYFPKVGKTSLDLEAIGSRMKTLKEQLMSRTRIAGDRGAVSAKLLPGRPLPERAMAKAA